MLSGMNDIAQVEENVRIASDATADALTEKDLEIFEKVKKSINQHMKVPCTGCGYCMPCPHGVDIPTCFAAYNTRYTDSFYSGMKAVSYTHLDVYKRQEKGIPQAEGVHMEYPFVYL